MTHLEKLFEAAAAKAPKFVPPTGSKREQGLEFIRRCKERDLAFEKMALEAEREGDSEGCWIAMAGRAENKRIMDKIQSDVDAMPKT